MNENQQIQGKIYIKTGIYAGAEIELGKEGIVIGRDPAQCQLIYDDPYVGRKHCQITYDEKKNLYYIEVFSVNGMLRSDGSKIKPGYLAAVNPGEVIKIGKDEIEFRTVMSEDLYRERVKDQHDSLKQRKNEMEEVQQRKDKIDAAWDVIKSFDKEKAAASSQMDSGTGNMKIEEWYLKYWAILIVGPILGGILYFLLFIITASMVTESTDVGTGFIIWFVIMRLCIFAPSLIMLWMRYQRYRSVRPAFLLADLSQDQREHVIVASFILSIIAIGISLVGSFATQKYKSAGTDADWMHFGMQMTGWIYDLAGDSETAKATEQINAISESDYVTVFHTALYGHAELKYLNSTKEIISSFDSSYAENIKTIKIFVYLFDISLVFYLITSVYVIYAHYKKLSSSGWILLIFMFCLMVFGSSVIDGANGSQLTLSRPFQWAMILQFISVVLWAMAWNRKVENPDDTWKIPDWVKEE